MEGCAGVVLEGTQIHMRDDEDRRAAEKRLVRDAQNATSWSPRAAPRGSAAGW
jgi:hypothetical protein